MCFELINGLSIRTTYNILRSLTLRIRCGLHLLPSLVNNASSAEALMFFVTFGMSKLFEL